MRLIMLASHAHLLHMPMDMCCCLHTDTSVVLESNRFFGFVWLSEAWGTIDWIYGMIYDARLEVEICRQAILC
jgi:hypothetical protein